MNQYTVLFVDDEPYILKSLSRLFRGDPVTILTSFSAEEALAVLRAQPVQVLVTDNIMPGMSGVELTKKVKELYPDTMRIILSGQSDIDAVIKAVNEGEAYRFLLKPWIDMDLKATVNIALAHHKLLVDNRRLMAELTEKSELLTSIQKRHPELLDEHLMPQRTEMRDELEGSMPMSGPKRVGR
ncbi:MAG: response regulator [Candidatus Zixiibacteriota bacterium]